VLDARDPSATRCETFEKTIENTFNKLNVDYMNKKIVFILSKINLVEPTVVEKWRKHLNNIGICIIMKAQFFRSFNFFGNKSLIMHLKDIKRDFFRTKKQLIVGIVGYPNVGKKSILNTLRKQKIHKCNVPRNSTAFN